MIKSELIRRITARNPHLYQRDVEAAVKAILGSKPHQGVAWAVVL